jgi:serine-protein kinase ATM
MSCRDTLFSSITKSHELRDMIPLSIRESRSLEIEALLVSSSMSRQHQALQDSLSTTTRITRLVESCKNCGLEIDAATTHELSNTLWDQGEMMLSIKLLKDLETTQNIEDQDIPVMRAALLAQLVSNDNLASMHPTD